MSAERLRELAARVRAGEDIDVERELTAMAFELAAFAEDFIRDANDQRNAFIRNVQDGAAVPAPSELEGLPGLGDR